MSELDDRYRQQARPGLGFGLAAFVRFEGAPAPAPGTALDVAGFTLRAPPRNPYLR